MHLVIPFAAARSDAAAHAAGTLALPNLERLLGRWAPVDAPADPAAPVDMDEYALSMPHERLVAGLRGWPVVDGLLPFAAEGARADGIGVPTGGGWALLTPTHWLVGRDQVTLLDPATLALDEREGRVFHDALAPLFLDLGWGFHWGGAGRWYASHPSLAALPTASIDRAIGRNVDLWLQDQPALLPVRRLQSEAQMLLYVHPLNDERAARGDRTLNSFWLSGTGPAAPADAVLPRTVAVDDRLRAPALAEDWSAWAEAWQALDAGPVRDLAEGRPAGAAMPRLSLCGERRAVTWQPASRPWWRGWVGARGSTPAAALDAL
jgi:hypothetical protein